VHHPARLAADFLHPNDRHLDHPQVVASENIPEYLMKYLILLLSLAALSFGADQSASNSGECEVTTGTFSQIRALRNADELAPGCTYCVTDYARGCLTAGIVTGICITADSVGTFGMAATVYTTLDVVGWVGRYDIDTGRILELTDDQGNHVDGDAGTEVERFPWAATTWTDNNIEAGAVLLCDCDPAIDLDDNDFASEANVDVRGASGYLRASTIESDAILELDEAGVLIRGLDMGSRGRIYGERATNVRIFYHNHHSEAYWIFRDRDDVRSYYSSMGSTTRVYYTGGTAQWFYYCDFDSYGFHRQFSGASKFYYSAWSSYAETRAETGSGDWFIYGGDFSSRSYVRNFNAGRTRIYYSTVDGSGRVNFNGNADKSLYYSNISGLSTLNHNGIATVVYAAALDSQSTFTVIAANHYRVTLDTLARVTTAFTTRQIYGKGSWTQTLTGPANNDGRDYFNNTLP